MNYHIGISGLRVAQNAIALVGTNISNAATPGYHRQRLEINPTEYGSYPNVSLGGATVDGSFRGVDQLLEKEILRQTKLSAQTGKELTTLQMVENAIGSLNSGGLGTSIDSFFNAIGELSTHPESDSLRLQVTRTADAMASQFRNVGQFLNELNASLNTEAENSVEKINQLSQSIAELNRNISRNPSPAFGGNILLDQRDQLITELSELGDVTTFRPDGDMELVNVFIWGIPLVTRTYSTDLEVGLDDQQKMGISIKDENYFKSSIQDGAVGAIISLKNEILPDIRQQIDNLASEIVTGINRHHVQGLGKSGSFSDLAGWALGDPTDDLSQLGLGIENGDVQIRITDSAGVVSMHNFSVNVTGTPPPPLDTLNSIVGKINALDPANLSAGIVNTRLQLQALGGASFDFLPASSIAMNPGWSGTAVPQINGIFTGQNNETYTVHVDSAGSVGIDAGVRLRVEDSLGAVVKMIDVGMGYAAGDPIEIVDGLTLSVSTGTLNLGAAENFDLRAVMDSDTSGILAATGLNAFLSGRTADSVFVRSEILADPDMLATSIGLDLTDNENVRRMGELRNTELSALNNSTPSEYFTNFTTEIGEGIFIRSIKKSGMDAVMDQLAAQRDSISGVDINEEAAKMMIYETMFQAMAKFIATLDRSMQSLMSIIQ